MQHARYKGINWRSSEKLKLNAFWLMLYVTERWAKTNKVNRVWFDDVVVATEYIGPPAAPGSELRREEPAKRKPPPRPPPSGGGNPTYRLKQRIKKTLKDYGEKSGTGE